MLVPSLKSINEKTISKLFLHIMGCLMILNQQMYVYIRKENIVLMILSCYVPPNIALLIFTNKPKKDNRPRYYCSHQMMSIIVGQMPVLISLTFHHRLPVDSQHMKLRHHASSMKQYLVHPEGIGIWISRTIENQQKCCNVHFLA